MKDDNLTVIRYTKTPYLFILLLFFIGLKLTGTVDWSWWWVFSPVLIPLALVYLVILFAGFFISS